MKKKNKVIREINYTADSVIDRGYDIYDVWQRGETASRRIVKIVERAVAATRKDASGKAFAEALAHLFALDLRISERYGTFIRRILSFFAYRRETRALERLKTALGIPKNISDIRTAIEVELKRLREKVKEKETDGDDETEGGKRNGKDDGEEAVGEEKSQDEASEEATEDSPEELSEAEEKGEAAEEKSENSAEQTANEEQSPENAELEVSEETVVEEKDVVEPLEVEEAESTAEISEDGNETEVAKTSEQTSERTMESYLGNGAVDIATGFEVFTDGKSAPEKPEEAKAGSFIDELIMDRAIRGERVGEGYNPYENIRFIDTVSPKLRGDEGRTFTDTPKTENGNVTPETKANESVQNTAKTESAAEQTAGQPTEQKIEQPIIQQLDQQMQNNDTTVEQVNKDDHRVPLQVDINSEMENKMRTDTNDVIDVDMLVAMHEGLASAMREHIKVEFGIEADDIEIIGKLDENTIEAARQAFNKNSIGGK